jgi:hypothetical protein
LSRSLVQTAQEKRPFFHSHLREAGLRFINAADIARELKLPAMKRQGWPMRLDANS